MRLCDVNKNNEAMILKLAYSALKIVAPRKFQVGNITRISRENHTFKKGDTPNLTTELSKIV